MLALFILTVGLGQFVSNTATVLIVDSGGRRRGGRGARYPRSRS